jgi:hypothetical protein
VIRRTWALIQAARHAPPSNLEFIAGIACLVMGASAVQRYVQHQRVLLAHSLAELGALRAQAATVAEHMETVIADHRLPDEVGRGEAPPVYPDAEDLDPVGRRLLDDGDPRPFVTEDLR